MAEKILIIDDEVDVAKMVVYRLKDKGYETITATTAEEGVAAAKSHIPDLIILDYRLPDSVECEVARRIKQVPGLKDKPIILVTASVENMEEKARQCQAADCIKKPIEPEELYEKVEKHI